MWAGLSAAWAQSGGFDGSGRVPPPDGATGPDPITGWGGRFPGAPVVEVSGQAADETVVELVTDAGATAERPVVDDLLGASVGVLAPVSQRVAVGLRLPIWLSSGGTREGGPAPGDAAVALPVRLLDADHAKLLLVPTVRLPTGAGARLLGDPAGGDLVLSAATGVGPLGLALDGGLGATGATGVPDWPGGPVGTWAGAVSLSASDAFTLLVEAAGRAPLGRPLPSVPAELLGVVRLRPAERLALVAGAGAGVIRGVGASALRMTVGARVALGPREVEALPVEVPPPSELRVLDDRGWPVTGAAVVVAGRRSETDADGVALLSPRAGRSGALDIEAEGFLPARLAVAEEERAWEVRLERRPVPVTISVVGPEGALPEVLVHVDGELDPDGLDGGPVTVDATGLRHVELPVGTWTLVLGAPGFGSQERTIVVPPGRTEEMRVDAVLAPVMADGTEVVVRVVDRHGAPVEDAVVAVAERDLGTTGSGGDVLVRGLPLGETAIVVRSSQLAERTVVQANVGPGRTELEVVLDWPAGAVLVHVTDGRGRAIDAEVRLGGPARLPPRSLGSDGEGLFVLRPGTWTLEVGAPAFGTQVRTVEVGDRPGDPLRLDLALLPAEGGEADLHVQVRDIDGQPIPGASVFVDGAPVGATGTDGDVILRDLDAGQRFLGVRGDLLVPLASEVELRTDQRELLVVSYTPGVVDLRVRDAHDDPLDARIAFAGSASVPSTSTGPDGLARSVLPPGTWEIAISEPAFGTRVETVVVAADERRRHLLDLRLVPTEEETGTLDVTVRDPDGRPVEARVALGGAPIGLTPGGALHLDGVPLGPTTLDVESPGLAPAHQDLVVDGFETAAFTLPWAPGAVAVTVSGPDGPLDGALVAFAGPSALPSRETEGGEARFAAAPGTWWVLASHPDYAVAEAELVVPAAPALTRLALALAPVPRDTVGLSLSVLDEGGRPVAGAAVEVDGVVVGETSAGGTFTLAEGDKGPAVVRLAPGGGLAAVSVPVALSRGEQARSTVVVPYAPAPVAITAAPDTRVTFYGDGGRATEVVAASDGVARAELPPGEYTVVATGQGVAGSAEIAVAPAVGARATVALVETGTTVADGRVRLTRPILFDVGSSALRPEAAEILDDVARRLLVERSLALVEVQGHTSDEGGVTFNQQLSEARARTLRDALVARGVEPERLLSRGYGLSRPADPGKDEAARALNRRVELVILDSAP